MSAYVLLAHYCLLRAIAYILRIGLATLDKTSQFCRHLFTLEPKAVILERI